MKREIWILLGVVMAVSLILGLSIGAVICRTNKDKAELRAEIQEFRERVALSMERVRVADSLFYMEVSILKEDIIALSKIREMSLKEAKVFQEKLEAESARRDSIGNSLLNW